MVYMGNYAEIPNMSHHTLYALLYRKARLKYIILSSNDVSREEFASK